MLSFRPGHLVQRLSTFLVTLVSVPVLLLLTGCGSSSVSEHLTTATVTVTASPMTIVAGASSVLQIVANGDTQLVLTGSDGTSYALSATGGTQTVKPSLTTTYTASATGTGNTATAQVTVTVSPVTVTNPPTVTISASPSSITTGGTTTLTVAASNATSVVITGTDGKSYTLLATGGTQAVTPAATTTYTATATAGSASVSASAVVTVTAPADISAVQHVIFMLQENHTFDNYFGMLNPYRANNGFSVGDDGVTYKVDGIDDKLAAIANPSDNQASYPLFKLTSTCIDDLSSSWLESYGDISRYDFSLTRQLNMDGFVHTAAGYAATCTATNGKSCSGVIKDFSGERAMGYYDEGFLNYYYYMASQFAVSDRWFSPLSSKSVPNRIATFSGGTTQGLAFDPGTDDHLPQLGMPTIFSELTSQNVSWKLYYTVTQGACLKATDSDCPQTPTAQLPATDFSYFSDSLTYLKQKVSSTDACAAPLTSSKAAVGDPTDSFCIDLNHIAPVSTYFTDLANNTLPSFSFIEAGYGRNDEHPGSGQSILNGQAQVAKIVSSLSGSTSWKNSVFFMAYDEGGGPYEHVPPVMGYSNSALPGTTAVDPTLYPDIKGIAVNADSYYPCLPPTVGTATIHCDLNSTNDPGANATDTTSLGPNQPDAAYTQGFAAQLGFRVPNMIISPFTRKHYVGHNPMDHTAILRFVEDRFLPAGHAYLTARDAAQPTLLDFFDFNNKPWLIPPTVPASAVAQDNNQTIKTLGYDPCTPTVYKKP